jgi:hypothetical protein
VYCTTFSAGLRLIGELIPGCGRRERLCRKPEFSEKALADIAVGKEFGDCISKVHGYGWRNKKGKRKQGSEANAMKQAKNRAKGKDRQKGRSKTKGR